MGREGVPATVIAPESAGQAPLRAEEFARRAAEQQEAVERPLPSGKDKHSRKKAKEMNQALKKAVSQEMEMLREKEKDVAEMKQIVLELEGKAAVIETEIAQLTGALEAPR